MDFLLDQPPWFVIGPAIAVIVLGLVSLMNVRIGVLGGWSDLIERAEGRKQQIGWKGWFVFGMIGGGLVFRLLAGDTSTGDGYGWVTRSFDDAFAPVAIVLLLGGILIGFGAKTASGCTSGNGLGGTSFGSPASFAATGTFMSVAIAGSFLIKAVT
jgi:uncharacterized membrane protein YedE/YeeE